MDLIDIQTTTNTFIAEGLVSHNSTEILANYFHRSIFNKNVKTFILTHDSSATNELFSRVKYFYSNLPEPIQKLLPLDRDSQNEMLFSKTGNSYRIGTAGNEHVGKSMTLHQLHLSEVAFYPKPMETASSLMNAVGDGVDTSVILESTANKRHDFFHRRVMSGLEEQAEYKTVFIPWFWSPEYSAKLPLEGIQRTELEEDLVRFYNVSDEQLLWRRYKITSLYGGEEAMFRRDYPCTVEEAFISVGESFFDNARIMAARKTKLPPDDGVSPVILGVDPGDRRTGMTLRCGRVLRWVRGIYENDVNELAGRILRVIEEEKVDKCFVDYGYGRPLCEVLWRLGNARELVVPVHFGAGADNKDIFNNKRTEMYHRFREWLYDGPVDIPDDEKFANELSVIPDSAPTGTRGVLGMPPKEKIKAELGISPDLVDSAVLTFAYPVMNRKASSRIAAYRTPDSTNPQTASITMRRYRTGRF